MCQDGWFGCLLVQAFSEQDVVETYDPQNLMDSRRSVKNRKFLAGFTSLAIKSDKSGDAGCVDSLNVRKIEDNVFLPNQWSEAFDQPHIGSAYQFGNSSCRDRFDLMICMYFINISGFHMNTSLGTFGPIPDAGP